MKAIISDIHGNLEALQAVSEESKDVDCLYRLDGRKTLVNVGSVGQPRDGDWLACYALLDSEIIVFRRVEYDMDTTARKIRDIDPDDFRGNGR